MTKKKWPSGGISGPDCQKPISHDRPVQRVFRDVFPDIPVTGFIGDSGGFTLVKTGLFGAVWIDDPIGPR
jgi:hypothetical protein